jgi:predicted RNase H-like HicB family nuclease
MGVFVASVPSLPGCHTQGKTYEEVMERVKEAVELYLEVAEKDPSYKEKVSPTPTFIGISDVAIKD